MSFTEYRLGEKRTPFGIIREPRIPVEILSPNGPLPFQFLVDTGADFSFAPRNIAELVELDWERLPATRMVGAELLGAEVRMGLLPLRIAEVALSVRTLFIDRAHAPLILGRADFLDRFTLFIDQSARRLVLTELPEAP